MRVGERCRALKREHTFVVAQGDVLLYNEVEPIEVAAALIAVREHRVLSPVHASPDGLCAFIAPVVLEVSAKLEKIRPAPQAGRVCSSEYISSR